MSKTLNLINVWAVFFILDGGFRIQDGVVDIARCLALSTVIQEEIRELMVPVYIVGNIIPSLMHVDRQVFSLMYQLW